MSNKTLDKDQIRQGDVLLVSTKNSSGEAEAIASDGSTVLAHGEVTGHRHRFERAAEAHALTGTTVRQLYVNVPGMLLHEEHSAPTVAPGHYDLPKQVEWTDANEPRAVED
jgi:hypothetical protein